MNKFFKTISLKKIADDQEILAHQKNKHAEHPPFVDLEHINEIKIPPDFEQAMHHHKSLTVGPNMFVSEIQDHLDLEYCECCARQVNKKILDINCQTNDISFLGSGYPLYFFFIKFSIFLLIFMLSAGGLYRILSNSLNGSDCSNQQPNQEQKCEKNWITEYSLGNIVSNDEIMMIQSWINFATVFFIIFVLQLFRYFQRRNDQICYEKVVECEEYSILVKNIPVYYDAKNDDYNEDLQEFFEKKVLPGCIIREVNLCFDQKTIQKNQIEINQQIKIKQEILRQIQKNQSQKLDIQTKRLKIELEKINKILFQSCLNRYSIQQLLSDGKGKNFMAKNFVGQAFISFDTQKQKDVVLHVKNNELLYHGSQIKIEQAPAPSDIYWKNLYVTTNEKIFRRSISFLIKIVLLGMSLSGIVAINYFRIKAAEEGRITKIYILEAASSLYCAVSNNLLQNALYYTIKFEQFSTRTHFNVDLGKSLSVCMFINTSLLPFFLSVVISNNQHYMQIFGGGGLASQMNYILIMNIFAPNVVALIDIQYMIKQIQRKYYLKKRESCVLTQSQLNNIFEDPEFLISQRFAVLLNILFSTAFYSSILPMAIIWGILSVFIQYWTDKYMLLRKRVVKFNQSSQLSFEMTEQLEYFLPIFSVSNIIFIYYSTDQIPSFPYILAAIIGCVHCFLPMQWLNEQIFVVRQAEADNQTYFEVKNQFSSTYFQENPVTRDHTTHEHKKELASIQLARRKFLNHIKVLVNMKSQQEILVKPPENDLNYVQSINQTYQIAEELTSKIKKSDSIIYFSSISILSKKKKKEDSILQFSSISDLSIKRQRQASEYIRLSQNICKQDKQSKSKQIKAISFLDDKNVYKSLEYINLKLSPPILKPQSINQDLDKNKYSFQSNKIQTASRLKDILKDKEKIYQIARAAFDTVDTDGSGSLEADELQKVIHNFSGDLGIEKISKEEVEEVLKELDENEDVKLSFEEFQVLIEQLIEMQADSDQK